MAENKKTEIKTQSRIADKMSILQVIASLIKNPLLLRSNEYKIELSDFPEQFHRIVFGAIEHLASQGIAHIGYMDIDQFLSKYPVQYKVFTDNKGPEYIIQAIDRVDEQNFVYYYQTLKKYSLLNSLKDSGYDITPFYDETILDPVTIAVKQQQFDKMTINDILSFYETKMLDIKEKFGKMNNMVQCEAGESLEITIAKFKETPEMGVPLTSKKLTTLYRGQRLGCFYLESSAQGVGKSRRMAAESAHIAVPEYYDLTLKRWVRTNLCENVLYISTELQLEEIQTIWVANISGVGEDKILDGKYTTEEEKRIYKAVDLIKKSNLFFVQISNYNIDDIENLIKKYYQSKQVNYVYYDYLSTTMKIMGEVASKTKVAGLREDQILLQFCIRLKDLCTNLGIYIWSATQLSGSWKSAKEADQELLRGAKSISDKIDIGSILLPVRESDKPIIAEWMKKGFRQEPTHCIHLYKVRRGHYNNIKIYIYFDRSIGRIDDCFITNNDGQILQVADTNVELILDATAEEKYGYSF